MGKQAAAKLTRRARLQSPLAPLSPLEQDALAHGQPVDGIPLHTCGCPPCFTAVEQRGAITCTPKCDLRYCDLDVGVCHAAPGGGGGGVGAGTVAVIVGAVVAILGGAGYLAYQYRIRSMMQQEVRAIMAQYMVRGRLGVWGLVCVGGWKPWMAPVGKADWCGVVQARCCAPVAWPTDPRPPPPACLRSRWRTATATACSAGWAAASSSWAAAAAAQPTAAAACSRGPQHRACA